MASKAQARLPVPTRSEEAFPDDDAVAIEQYHVILAAVDDLLEVVFESLLGAGDDALQDDLFRRAVRRSAGGGQSLQQRRRLRAPELHAARMHHFAEYVDVDLAVDRNVDDVIRTQREVEIGISVDHQIVDVDRDLLGQTIRRGAQDVERAPITVGQTAGLRDGLDQRDVSCDADRARPRDGADHRDRLAVRFEYRHRDIRLVDVLLEHRFEPRLEI